MPMQSRNFNPQHVEQLAMRLKQNGLVSSMTDAMALAKSLTDANTSTSSYGSEKIPNPHATQQRRHPDGIDNLRREECAAPLAYLNRERRTPGRIENLPDHLQGGRVCAVQMHYHEAPRSEPAVFQAKAPVVEAPQEDPYEDERAIKDILQQDDELVYGNKQQPAPAPAPVQAPAPAPAPVREEQPVIRPAQVVQPAPAPAPQASQAPQTSPSEIPTNKEGRGRGLSKEEAAITDISKIFYYGGR